MICEASPRHKTFPVYGGLTDAYIQSLSEHEQIYNLVRELIKNGRLKRKYEAFIQTPVFIFLVFAWMDEARVEQQVPVPAFMNSIEW